MALDQLYQQLILEHNRNPRNFGPLSNATHSARGQDALCGDDLLIELQVQDGRIVQAAFSGEACAVTRASASLLTSWVAGRQVGDLARAFGRFRELLADPGLPDLPELGDFNRLRAVGRFPSRLRNAELPWRALLAALESASLHAPAS